eukprot:Gb_40567 [translate_table: standard]
MASITPSTMDHKANSLGEYLYRSKLPDIEISNHLLLHAYGFKRLDEFAEKPCLIDGFTGKIYKYGEVALISRKVTARLTNSIRGTITTIANPFYTPGEIANRSNASGAHIIVTQAIYAEKLSNLNRQNLIVITTDSPPVGCQHISVMTEADENECPFVNIDSDDVVALPYSAGTTGLPKGVIVGAAVLVMQKYNIRTILELIQRYKITAVSLVPPMLLELSKSPIVSDYNVSSIRTVKSGAAPVGKKLVDAVRARFSKAKFGQGYGMTEAGRPVIAMCLSLAKHPSPTKFGSCRTVIRNAQGKIIDTETGLCLPHNQPGEICFR